MKPEILQELSQPLVDVYLSIENELMQNIAKHLAKGTAIGTNQWNIEKLQELNALYQENYDILVQNMQSVDYELYQSLKMASESNLTTTNRILDNAVAKGLIQQPTFRPKNTVMANILDAYYKDAKEKFNLVNTTMLQGSTNEYVKILNKTTGKVLTGVSTPQEALRQSVKEFADKGVPALIDRRGRQWTPEAYIDNVIRSTSNNVANEMQFARMDEFDVDLLEVSSHVGARPKCEPYQGRIFSKSGRHEKYPAWSITSYGDAGGLLGCNCRHVTYPFIEGLSTQTYKPYDHELNKKVYEESQVQRKIERDIRNAKREKEMFEKIGDQTGIDKANQKIKDKQANMRAFINDTGRTRQPHREQIVSGGVKPQKPISVTPPKPTNGSLFNEKMMKQNGMTDEYKNILSSRFANGSELAQNVFIKNVPENSIVNSAYTGTAHYSPRTQKINMNFAADTLQAKGAGTTYYHEHGHLIDMISGKPVSSDSSFGTALRSDYNSYIMNYMKSNKIKYKADAYSAVSDEIRPDTHSSVSDLFGGISKGKCEGNWGHRQSYWKRDPQLVEIEAFAHFYEAQFDTERLEILQHYFPTATDAFNKLLEGLQ